MALALDLSRSISSLCNCAPKRRALIAALLLLLTFALAEFGVGLYSHSIALRVEAGHMLSDAIAIGIALSAAWTTVWLKSHRAEPLAAALNSALLLGLAGWLAWESVEHLTGTPEEILSGPMLAAALGGVVVNGISATMLHQHSHDDLNVRGAFLHMLADVTSSLGVLLAALIVWQTGWYWVDGLIGLGVALLIGGATVPLLIRSLAAARATPPDGEPADKTVSLSMPPSLSALERRARS